LIARPFSVNWKRTSEKGVVKQQKRDSDVIIEMTKERHEMRKKDTIALLHVELAISLEVHNGDLEVEVVDGAVASKINVDGGVHIIAISLNTQAN
jgi:hypothetical protein